MKLILLGILFGVAETAYFGFNRHAQSHNEQICDAISATMIIIGFLRTIHSTSSSDEN